MESSVSCKEIVGSIGVDNQELIYILKLVLNKIDVESLEHFLKIIKLDNKIDSAILMC